MNKRRCKICNTILEDWEDEICQSCQNSMLQKDGIDLGFGDEYI